MNYEKKLKYAQTLVLYNSRESTDIAHFIPQIKGKHSHCHL